MAQIAPFVGIRYDQSRTGDLSKVTCPPYDVISPQDRAYYHGLHENNFVRLVLGEEFETDNDSNNRFTRARHYLNRWLEQGILVSDPAPAVYSYEQQFEREGRTKTIRGITCAVRLHTYAEHVVLPHEYTLAKPKSQLGALIRETRANLDSIYGLYADAEHALDAVIRAAEASVPCAEAADKNGVRHRSWMISNAREIAKVTEFLHDRPIAIADGHHRYETALAYCKEMREQCGDDAHPPSDYVLMTIANVYQPDMTIFPTHRVVAHIENEVLAGLNGALEEQFEIARSDRKNLLSDMARLGAIGMYRPGEALTLKPRPRVEESIPGSEASRKLELNVLHKLVLEKLLSIDADKLRNQTHIHYTRDANEALDLVDSGERQAAFLLNNIDVKSVLEVASAGERMPQKATYFYPKLLSGLVLRKME